MAIGLGRDEHVATRGEKSVAELKTRAAHMPTLDTEPLELEGVEVLQVAYEMWASANTAVLPPGLHPTYPPLVSWVFFEVTDGPLGSFRMVQARLGCRSGTRPRAFLVSAVVDNEDVGRVLEQRWGYHWKHGEIDLRLGYDESQGVVRVGGKTILDVRARNPFLLRPQDVFWLANMNLAETPRGLRLVQVDPDVSVKRAERLTPRLDVFDAAAWGEPLIEVSTPVSASKYHANFTLPRIRFLCDPEKAAFHGTEQLAKSR